MLRLDEALVEELVAEGQAADKTAAKSTVSASRASEYTEPIGMSVLRVSMTLDFSIAVPLQKANSKTRAVEA